MGKKRISKKATVPAASEFVLHSKKGTQKWTRSPKEDTPNSFKVTIKLGDKEFTSSGETVYDALRALETPVKIVSKGFVCVEGNGKRVVKMLMPMQMKRLFWPLAQRVQAKNLEVLLK